MNSITLSQQMAQSNMTLATQVAGQSGIVSPMSQGALALAGGVTGQSSTTDGLPNDSMMFTTGQIFNNLSSFTAFTPNALSSYSIAQMNGSNTGSGNIGGWTINPTQISSPNGNIVLNAGGNEIIFYSNGMPTIVIQG